MDIVHDNFIEKLDFILDSVRQADFIALDTEFSGLSVHDADQTNAFDNVETRYQKLRHNCLRMNAFQVGIACFKKTAQGHYESRPFNFYVFPKSKLAQNSLVQFKSSNIKFLIKNHFDFDKLFRDALSYQRLSDIDKVR